jgi:hypothetical protein
VQAQPLSLDEKCKKLEETIQKVATNTIGSMRKQANKEWFEEECEKVNEETNAATERAIQIQTRGAKNAYKLARTKERSKNQVLARWKEHFEEHLNKGSESEQPTCPVDLRDDGVNIDLPSREEIEGALKYLENNKAAGADSIAA